MLILSVVTAGCIRKEIRERLKEAQPILVKKNIDLEDFWSKLEGDSGLHHLTVEEEYDEVCIRDGFQVSFNQISDSNRYSFVGSREAYKALDFEVRDRVLYIGFKEGTHLSDHYSWIGIEKKIKPKRISLSDNSSATGCIDMGDEDFTLSLKNNSDWICNIKAKNLNVECTNNSDFECAMDVESLSLSVTKNSEANLQGDAKHIGLEVLHNSNVSAPWLDTETAWVHLAKNCNATISCNKNLSGIVRDGSHLKFFGECIHNDLEAKGSYGEIEQLPDSMKSQCSKNLSMSSSYTYSDGKLTKVEIK